MDGHRERIEELRQEIEEVKSGYGYLEGHYNEMQGKRINLPGGKRGEAAEIPGGNRGEAAETGPRAGNVSDRVTSNTGPKKEKKGPGFFEKFIGAIDNALA